MNATVINHSYTSDENRLLNIMVAKAMGWEVIQTPGGSFSILPPGDNPGRNTWSDHHKSEAEAWQSTPWVMIYDMLQWLTSKGYYGITAKVGEYRTYSVTDGIRVVYDKDLWRAFARLVAKIDGAV